MSLRPDNYEDAKAAFKPLKRTGFRKPALSPSRNGNASGAGRARKGALSQRRRKPLKAGKKVKAWESERRKLKKRFEAVGITTCELEGALEHDCKHDDWLSFAHNAKRRKLGPEDLSHVILVCTVIHDKLEAMSPEKMKQIVDETIQSRKIQL